MKIMKRDDNGQWVPAEPIGWQEEHARPVRILYSILGLAHCGKSGWRKKWPTT